MLHGHPGMQSGYPHPERYGERARGILHPDLISIHNARIFRFYCPEGGLSPTQLSAK
jgi:hypothetical protein